jgi:leader peptidase (prepilin peptidase) / N-methyltransferase
MLPFLADLPPSYFALLAFIFGLAVGSFLNVVIHRVPLGQGVVWLASHCPACERPLQWRDNVPVISYVWLRGRCRYCSETIGWRYPLVELGTALVWAALAWHHGASWQAVSEMVFALFLIALAVIDAEHFLLPDVLTYPLFLLALVVSTFLKMRGAPLSPSLTVDLFLAPPPDFSRTQALTRGALILLAVVPCLWLLDWLDDKLFARYFAAAENDASAADTADNAVIDTAPDELAINEPSSGEAVADDELWQAIEAACARQRRQITRATLVASVVCALAWMAWLKFDLRTPSFTLERAYDGLTDAAFGALVAGGVLWFLRTMYFLIRGQEGMGLGDVKMMAGVGAFLGWIDSFFVMMFGSVLGAVVGLIFMALRRFGRQTPLPFGTCLALAALLLLFHS